jgi:sugar fermentation stimulation protein A
MLLPSPLVGGHLVRRYKRFFADVTLDDGTVVTAHCPNTGTMHGLNAPGLRVWLSRSDNPKRKLAHTWDLVEETTGEATHFVGINPLRANKIVAEALAAQHFDRLAGYETVRPEVRYGDHSRVDFLLSGGDRPDCYVEVKNVHLKRERGLAEFPDAVTSRGAKHLHELARMVEGGHRAVMLYLVQRDDCDRFAVAADLDPAYAKALDMAVGAGVEVVCVKCRLTLTEIAADHSIEFIEPREAAL